jgi:hypothetical protein
LNEVRFIDEDDLAELQRVDDPAMKRAGLWDYFAGLTNTHAEQVHIFRFEDMIEGPATVLKYAYQRLFPDREYKLPNIDPGNQVQEFEKALADWKKECIRAICSNNAGAFHYQLYKM